MYIHVHVRTNPASCCQMIKKTTGCSIRGVYRTQESWNTHETSLSKNHTGRQEANMLMYICTVCTHAHVGTYTRTCVILIHGIVLILCANMWVRHVCTFLMERDHVCTWLASMQCYISNLDPSLHSQYNVGTHWYTHTYIHTHIPQASGSSFLTPVVLIWVKKAPRWTARKWERYR